jgi:hypothetical protein
MVAKDDEGPTKTKHGLKNGIETIGIVPEYAQWNGELEAVVRLDQLGIKDKQAAELALQGASQREQIPLP